MKKVTLTGLLVAALFTTSAMAEGTSVSDDMTFSLSLERAIEANTQNGEFSVAKPLFGITASNSAKWDIDADGKDFLDLNKQMLNFSFPLQDNVTIYLKNDLNDSFERTESVIGTSITF